MSYSDRYSERIEQLENEVKEKQEEIEITNSQTTIDILEEEIEEEVRTKKEQMEFETSGKRLAILEEEVYNTEQSIEELKKHA